MAHNDIADETLRAIRRILRKTSGYSRQLSRQSGLTVPQVLCLRFIAEATTETEITVAMVSQAVQLAPATVSRILDRLEDADLVIRERRSQDRRKVCLSLTELGRKQVDTLPTPLQEQFVARLRALPASEQRGLLDSLQKVVEMMEATDLDAAPLLESGEAPYDS
ncbi:MarR family winged helix-turn-helix transcriptional regulator [Lignipirellula cremea]|uniref:HTH-type transcriptional regulator MgrA n=1 Tax=Lignipirellula cremea TaxID=2528010 RepID=A0A518E0S6_9BACT|nr:MarR family transcriptional regulator [Lignipirellula cremea]QDU97695.1 HTH-type transcriptional regulator MgrA [Lignipirellula cremea]